MPAVVDDLNNYQIPSSENLSSSGLGVNAPWVKKRGDNFVKQSLINSVRPHIPATSGDAANPATFELHVLGFRLTPME